jgi:hypothetical protein
MSEETKKAESGFSSIVNRILKPGSKKSGEAAPATAASTGFHWFTLIPIPPTEGKTVDTFNDEAAKWAEESLRDTEDISFVELYLTRAAMNRLIDTIKIDKSYAGLVETIRQQLFTDDDGGDADSSKVSFNRKGLLITPALQHVFDNAFIARSVVPPQVYAPADESKIPSTVDQYLIGALKVQDAKGKQTWETPIRALLGREGEPDDILRLYAHTDFDILLKAFPDEAFCSYPLGINIRCLLQENGGRRVVSQVDLDIQDTKMLASMSQSNASAKLFYEFIEGGEKYKDISTFPDGTYPVDLKKVTDSYEIAPGLSVPVTGKVGLKVILKYTNKRGQADTDTYTFLFRFFKNALRFSTGTNKLSARGQFVRGSGETVVMLPPLFKDGSTESQTPAFIISPPEDGGSTFSVRKHPDSTLSLSISGVAVGTNPTPIDLTGKVDISGEIGAVGDSQHEKFNFTLRPIAALNEERKRVAELREERGYVAFVEISSDRTISLAKNEIVLGRNQFLGRSANASVGALTLTRRYVTWVMSARKDEKVLYYSTSQGTVRQPVGELTQPISLGLVGTYYIYIDDFEFMIFLESTPRTEILLDSNT